MGRTDAEKDFDLRLRRVGQLMAIGAIRAVIREKKEANRIKAAQGASSSPDHSEKE